MMESNYPDQVTGLITLYYTESENFNEQTNLEINQYIKGPSRSNLYS